MDIGLRVRALLSRWRDNAKWLAGPRQENWRRGCRLVSMRYWWVNQNQTYRHEVAGGYLWSPKRNANSARNPFYETMREVAPGDSILSFVDTRLVAIGIAQSYCWESPKPAEFGDASLDCSSAGCRADIVMHSSDRPDPGASCRRRSRLNRRSGLSAPDGMSPVRRSGAHPGEALCE